MLKFRILRQVNDNGDARYLVERHHWNGWKLECTPTPYDIPACLRTREFASVALARDYIEQVRDTYRKNNWHTTKIYRNE
jgi:hypothetical protein